MFAVNTLDTITDGSTLKYNKGKKTKKKKDDHTPATQDSSDQLNNRSYSDPLMCGKYGGHKDTKNHRLTVKNKDVHNVTHANEMSRNAGDFRKHISESKYHGDSRVMRSMSDTKPRWGCNGPIDWWWCKPGNEMNTQPPGCNGPVMCKTGKAMQGVMTPHDPNLPIHAAHHENLAHGGVARSAYEKVGMIGAGGTVPKDTPNNVDLNSAAGLHYAMNISPGNAYTNMNKQNFMQGMTGK